MKARVKTLEELKALESFRCVNPSSRSLLFRKSSFGSLAVVNRKMQEMAGKEFSMVAGPSVEGDYLVNGHFFREDWIELERGEI